MMVAGSRWTLTWRRLSHIAARSLLALASRMIPRTKLIWVVGGSKGIKYADNSMHFFRYCSQYTDKRVVWLTWSSEVVDEVRADGYEAHCINSLRGTWLGLRAKWHIFDVTPRDTGMTSRGAHLLNLWHGIPLKDIRFLKRRPKPATMFHWLGRRILADKNALAKMYFVHPDRKHIKHILDSFELLPQNIIYANLPRNNFSSSHEQPFITCKPGDLRAVSHIEDLANNGARIIGYFPTWRGNGNDKFLGTLDPAEIIKINTFLKQQDLYLVTKWHDCVYSVYGHIGGNISAENSVAHLQQQSNIIVLAFEADLNSHLPLCDILITDYSSVLFDYLLLDRPMLFFAHDVNAYRDEFGFLYDYEKFVPGDLLTNSEDLYNELAVWNSNPELYSSKFKDRRRKYRSIFFEHPSGPELIIRSMLDVTDI